MDNINQDVAAVNYHQCITEDMAKSIACALIGSRLDYANSVLLGVWYVDWYVIVKEVNNKKLRKRKTL